MRKNLFESIDAVILAGGKSQRMGRDKALLNFGDFETLAQYQYQKLSKIFSTVYLSSKEKKFDFFENSSKLILDKELTYSPMVALKTIFETIQTPQIFILPVDTPFITQETIHELLLKHTKKSSKITVAKDSKGKIHNLCGVFERSILKEIEECLSQDIHKIHYLIDCVGFESVSFENDDEFLNMNTLEEYYKAITQTQTF